MTDERGVADSVGGETRGGGLPDVIHLPDQSRPDRALKPSRPRGKKGRHFGPRPVADARSERIDLRVTPAQRAAIKAAAKAAGLSVSAFICQRTLGDAGPRVQRIKPGGPDMMLLGQIKAGQGRIGGNLNQFVKRLNSYDFHGIPELLALRAAAEAALADHRAASGLLMQALGGRSVTDDH
jgi:Protein of unknown function (DUF1778)